jgi:hypothetical protein
MAIQVLSFLAVVFLLVAPAAADTVYTYTSDYFTSGAGVYTTADRITGSLTVAEGFAPAPVMAMRLVTEGVLHYAFTDGHQTLTEANSTGTFYVPRFDMEPLWGQHWNVSIGTPTSYIHSDSLNGHWERGFLDANNQGGSSSGSTGRPDGSHPGTWTVTTVREPMSLGLVGAGIGGLIGARRFYRN